VRRRGFPGTSDYAPPVAKTIAPPPPPRPTFSGSDPHLRLGIQAPLVRKLDCSDTGKPLSGRAEQVTENPRVAGSIPALGTT
jgi:hypothetical protein